MHAVIVRLLLFFHSSRHVSNASQDPDAGVEAVLIPEKHLLDPEWTSKFDDESSTEGEGALVVVGHTGILPFHVDASTFTQTLDRTRQTKH